jgi:hypothetical protein
MKEKPWWAPDAQGFLAGGIVILCGLALFVRMFRTSDVDDKMIDTMITILFSTCLVTVYNFWFGSSRGSSIKDETIVKMAAASPVAAMAAAKAVAPIAAAIAAPPAAEVAAPPAAEAAVEKAMEKEHSKDKK